MEIVSFLHKIIPGNTFRCFSKSSTKTRRSYNKLIAPPGSSLRRARSHSRQPPAATADHLAALELAHSRSLRMNNVDVDSKLSYFTYGSRRVHSGTYEVSRETSNGNVSQRRF